MNLSGNIRILRTASLISLSILTAAIAISPVSIQAQELPQGPNQAKPIDPNDPNVVRPTGQETGILSFQAGQRLMQEANAAVSAQNYPLAVKKLQEARQVFNQLSNFYQDLAGSFSGIDNRISDSQRRKALETAQLRDDATYQLAIVHRAQNQPELAVPLLVQIIRSQQPTRELGQKAYRQLFELGFVDSPYPRNSAEQPAAPASSSANKK
jgi:cell division septum initiation protein DivIVA